MAQSVGDSAHRCNSSAGPQPRIKPGSHFPVAATGTARHGFSFSVQRGKTSQSLLIRIIKPQDPRPMPTANLTDSPFVLRARDGTEYPLATVTLIGREADCQVILDDSRVSRYHAKLTV